ncbi:MAG: dihydroorotate dehydrogenase [Clostridia bacterium]|jgi:dihydroorotate dehydrogenase (NAD+) catalytic subunit
MNLSVRIADLVMQNPVGVASGTSGYGEEYGALMDVQWLGALYTKAVTPEPRIGNPAPRLADTPAGMLNSIGLANPGLNAFIREKLPVLATGQQAAQRCAVIVNVAGRTEEDYRAVVEALEDEDGVDGYEINVSCPNVAHGGMAFGTDCILVERLTKTLRDCTQEGAHRRPGGQRRPVIVKLSPNVTDITATAKAAEAGGADAVSCINTLVGMVIDVKQKRPVLAMKTGGLSGPAIRPVGVAAVYKVSRAVRIPVIGLGGITDADDALQYLLAGACAIQVGTALFNRPETPAEVLAGITAFMEREKLDTVGDISKLLH